MGALGFTAVVAGGYTFFFSAMKEKTDSSAELTAKFEELSGKEEKLSASVSMLSLESTQIEKLKSYFIKQSEIVPFTKKIEALGGQSGAVISLESLEPGVSDTNTPTLSFHVKATGKFKEVMQAMTLLENFPAKFEWKTVRLVHEEGSPAQLNKKGLPQASLVSSRWVLDMTVVALNFVPE